MAETDENDAIFSSSSFQQQSEDQVFEPDELNQDIDRKIDSNIGIQQADSIDSQIYDDDRQSLDKESIDEASGDDVSVGADDNVHDDDELSFAANVRLQNPYFTHRICFLNEDDVNKMGDEDDDGEQVSESELDESLRSLVHAYSCPSPPHSSHPRSNTTASPRHQYRHQSSGDYERRSINGRNSAIGTNETQNTSRVREKRRISAMNPNDKGANNQASFPLIPNPSKTFNDREHAKRLARKGYKTLMSATSKIISNYFHGNDTGDKSGIAREERWEEGLTEEEKVELNIQLASSFIAAQQLLEKEAKWALGQAKNMAKMQVQLESQARRTALIVNQVLYDNEGEMSAKSVGSDDNYRQSLVDVDVNKLLKLKQRLTEEIAITNVQLVDALVVKDNLRTQQEDLLVEIEDFTRHAQNQLHELQLLKASSKTSYEN
ncbi:uncharacterized protein LOC134846302 isoform X1 [Symsagittifera roscoffensis]|uniref:uncharacterized protein LOC134846302 isoform X1 n=1 Tax=Symsagittifera roscoffensis TaxID=84072 RepID=UPI00307CA908